MKPVSLLFLFLLFVSTLFSFAEEERRILIAVSDNASPAVKNAAQSLAGAPLFAHWAKVGGASSATPEFQSSESLLPDNAFKTAAYNHLIVVGLRDEDPLLEKCWGNQIGLRKGEIDTLGYGHWKGDFGTVECDRNPFLYSHKVKDNPYTTNIVKISGTTAAGLIEAVKAFQAGLLNGIVPVGKIELVEKSILDRQPDCVAPPQTPERLGEMVCCGWTQIREEEYRAYYDFANCRPARIWRIKYLAPKCFDNVSGRAWVEGLHRLAYGNTVSIVQFETKEDAVKTFEAVAKAKNAKEETVGETKCVRFDQPVDTAFEESYGAIRYFVKEAKLFAVSLPERELAELLKTL